MAAGVVWSWSRGLGGLERAVASEYQVVMLGWYAGAVVGCRVLLRGGPAAVWAGEPSHVLWSCSAWLGAIEIRPGDSQVSSDPVEGAGG